MAENETGQERTEEATAKRKEDSRKKGEIARSKELTTVLMMLIAGAGFFFLGSGLITDLLEILRLNLDLEREIIFDVGFLNILAYTSLYILISGGDLCL